MESQFQNLLVSGFPSNELKTTIKNTKDRNSASTIIIFGQNTSNGCQTLSIKYFQSQILKCVLDTRKSPFARGLCALCISRNFVPDSFRERPRISKGSRRQVAAMLFYRCRDADHVNIVFTTAAFCHAILSSILVIYDIRVLIRSFHGRMLSWNMTASPKPTLHLGKILYTLRNFLIYTKNY